jgi:hypothetical protein
MQFAGMLPSDAFGALAFGLPISLPSVIVMLVHWSSVIGWAFAVADTPIAMLPNMIPAATSGPDSDAVSVRRIVVLNMFPP